MCVCARARADVFARVCTCVHSYVRVCICRRNSAAQLPARFQNPKKKEKLLRMCVVFYSSFVNISAYSNFYFKTILRECLRAELPPGFPSIAPPPVRVSAVLGTLAVWVPNQKKKKMAHSFSHV